MMLAYHGDAAFREKFLGLIRWHREQDAIATGTCGTKRNGQWQGCAVGCSLRSLDMIRGVEYDDRGIHARYPEGLGIPEQLAHLENRLFESLQHPDRLDWPLRFSEAIQCGADLSLVWPRFALWLLVDETDGVIQFARMHTRPLIRSVADLFKRQIDGGTVTVFEWRSAASSAASASASASSAYDAYAYYAYDAYAAYAASAAYDAYAAGTAAGTAASAYARSATRTAAIKRQANKLIELLSSAPVVAP